MPARSRGKAGFVSGAFNLIISPILAFFILKDLPKIKETVVNLFPEQNRLEFLNIVSKVNKVLSGFLKGQLIIAIFVGTIATIWFAILGLPFSLLLGMLVGLLNIIPYFGPIVGGGLAALVGLFNSPLTALLVIIGMIVISQVDAALISPLVLKKQVDLHPVLIIFAMLIGGSLMGILGFLLAVPVAAVLKVMVYHFIEKRDGFPET